MDAKLTKLSTQSVRLACSLCVFPSPCWTIILQVVHFSVLKQYLRCGDVLLFKCANTISGLQRTVTGSEWDHGESGSRADTDTGWRAWREGAHAS